MARVDGRTARWEGHRVERRAAFVAAAVTAIGEHGPGATVDQIAGAAGAGRQALYRHFADRRDLDHAVAEHAAALLVAALQPHLEAGPVPLDRVEGRLREGLLGYLGFVQDNLALYRFVRAHEAEVAADSAVRQVKETVGGRIAALAREVLAGLDLADPSADVFATGVVGMADAVVSRWLDDPAGLTPEALADALVPMLGGAVRGALEVLATRATRSG